MEKYLGVKLIEAEPQSQDQAAGAKNFGDLSKLSGGVDREGYKVVYEGGYISWSPKDVFEKAYRRIDNLTFGLVIEALKQGKKVAREGWNGKNMFLEMVSHRISKNQKGLIYDVAGNEYEELPWIGMKTVDNKFVPWLASQTDMLAEDWIIVE